MMRVVATILHFNSPDGTREVVRRLAAQTRPPDAVVLVDNGSREAVDLAEVSGPLLVDVLRNETNLGVGAGHNRAIRHALDAHAADAVWVLEHDTFPDADCLEALLRVHAAAATPAVVATELTRNNYERQWLPKPGSDGEALPRVTLNGPLLPREVIDLVGLLNEELFVGQEDWEYSERLTAAGVPILRAATAVALHANKGDGRFGREASPTRLYYSGRNRIALASAGRVGLAARMLGGAAVDLFTRGRGRVYAAARWHAGVDGLRGNLGPRAYRFMLR